MRDKNKQRLLHNTLFLYILTFSGYFFSLVTVPYQTRILGPEFYGKVGFAVAMMTYFRLIIDFGFILSATADISKNREDKQEVARIYTAVMYAKGLLTAVSLVVLLGICYAVPMFRQDIFLYVLTFASVAVSAFLPDFFISRIGDNETNHHSNGSDSSIFCMYDFPLSKKPSTLLLRSTIHADW
ncbi:polysaccharide biosynthesis protein [Listeria weihenstephanensis FSL R9-0317]|uniref:oligosaccharide flippase family protein n=1 Tax=Listeria weihenstephanensis TaxID=1006155 RepID=UPI0003E8C047|nr:oligosaccharide flippase family protein [Listeria weihenstephanensis]EUJ40097.1 polysaccharide biosynthesis protein [Listeria weihenstephanensis FSL R9-0317]